MNLLENGKPIDKFSHMYTTYKRDNRAVNSLNKVLGTDFLAVYRDIKNYWKQWSSPELDLSNETFYILRKDGKVVEMSNSEWLRVKLIGDTL